MSEYCIPFENYPKIGKLLKKYGMDTIMVL